MIDKIKNIFFAASFLIFLFLTSKYYFSDENFIYTNKSRSSYTTSYNENLPLLKNDTDNIVTYKNDVEEYKKNIKIRLWEKLLLRKNDQ